MPKTSVPISDVYRTEGFDCGAPPLNDYLKKFALINHKNGSSRTYVALKDNSVIGYFSLSYGSVEHQATPPRISQGLGRYPVPVLVITRLAVDITFQAEGMGKALLKQALLKALNASEIAGLRAIVVHAKDEKAKSFYENFGFSPSPLDDLHLYLLLKDIPKNLN
ncbi:MAG: GNAT family N-acetyltransferase [Alphaproteobacteria bacterium]